MKRTPRFSGRIYREDGNVLADYRDAADGTTTYGLLISAADCCSVCGTPRPIGCDCLRLAIRRAFPRRFAALLLAVLLASCSHAAGSSVDPRETCVTDMECQEAWGFDLGEAMSPEVSDG